LSQLDIRQVPWTSPPRGKPKRNRTYVLIAIIAEDTSLSSMIFTSGASQMLGKHRGSAGGVPPGLPNCLKIGTHPFTSGCTKFRQARRNLLTRKRQPEDRASANQFSQFETYGGSALCLKFGAHSSLFQGLLQRGAPGEQLLIRIPRGGYLQT
jgi:hypothetical protein